MMNIFITPHLVLYNAEDGQAVIMYLAQLAQGTSAQNRSTLTTALIIVVTLIPLYYGSWRFRSVHTANQSPIHDAKPAVWSDAFVDQWLDAHIIPFDSWPLKAYCNHSQWRPDLVFSLDDANGGIGNIKGNFLDFMIYAIEAGASIMLPSRARRSQEDLFNVWADRAEFDTFFDEEWFVSSMNEACPQMAIYKAQSEHEMVEPLAARYQPPSRRVDIDPAWTSAAYVENFNNWLKDQSDYDSSRMTLVKIGRMLWDIDTRSLPEGMRRSLGQVLRTAPHIRRLAALVTQMLAKQHLLDINPAQPIPKHAFFGAHLRTEADAAQAGWLKSSSADFSAQSDAYIRGASKNKLHTIYIASGDASEIDKFKEKAAQQIPPLNVSSKMDLLDEEGLVKLNDLRWDQRALIDYEVLQRCSVFGGFVRSSFSLNIALTRHEWLASQGLVTNPWLVMHTEDSTAFDDGISRIIGRDELHERRAPRGTWP